MTATSSFRGWEIFYSESKKEWLFSDDNSPVKTTYKLRPCGKCLKHSGKDGIDPCLKFLPGVMNACCGHGKRNEAYIQFENEVTIRGFDKIELPNREEKQ